MSYPLQLASMPVPVGSLDAYIQSVNQIPLLTAEEEQHFAKRFHEEGCLDSARQLVLSHLRYVVKVARGYMGYGLPLGDLIQEGNLGLMKAVKRFDPSVGVRLVSFAIHWIKAEIHDYVLKNWRIVKVATTKAQRKLFFNLRQMKNRLGWFDAEEIQTIADDLGVSQEEVVRMEQRMHASDASFDSEPGDTDETYKSPAYFLGDKEADPARILERERQDEGGRAGLMDALSRLDERSQDILQQRWLVEKKMTLHELADKYGVSAERVRQLEKNAMQKLRRIMDEALVA